MTWDNLSELRIIENKGVEVCVLQVQRKEAFLIIFRFIHGRRQPLREHHRVREKIHAKKRRGCFTSFSGILY